MKCSYSNVFVNSYNKNESKIFDCDINVAAGVDGGSVRHIMCYVSKNTFVEDSEKHGANTDEKQPTNEETNFRQRTFGSG